jgi:hypothetical protein
LCITKNTGKANMKKKIQVFGGGVRLLSRRSYLSLHLMLRVTKSYSIGGIFEILRHLRNAASAQPCLCIRDNVSALLPMGINLLVTCCLNELLHCELFHCSHRVIIHSPTRKTNLITVLGIIIGAKSPFEDKHFPKLKYIRK